MGIKYLMLILYKVLKSKSNSLYSALKIHNKIPPKKFNDIYITVIYLANI